MRSLFLIAFIFLQALPCSLKAQDTLFANLPQQWRLQDCIEYAKKKNISLATLRLTTRSTEEDLLQSKAGILPDLAGSVSQNLGNGNNVNQSSGTVQNKTNFSSSYDLNSSMIIYKGGYLKNDIRSKQFSLQSADLSVQETENSLTLSITQAFFNILLAREIITSVEALLSTSQGQLLQGQQRFDAGSIARKELAQLESQVATDQYNLVNANNNFKLNTVDLKQLLLLPSSFDLQIKAPDSILLQPSLTSLYDAQHEALQTRPEIKNKEVQIQISQVELEKIKASVKPTISLGAGLSTGYSNNGSAVYLSQVNNNFYQSLGISMGIPIYSRRVNKTNINKSKILLQQSQLALYDAKTILNQQVERAYINLLNAQAQYNAAEVQLRKSEEIYFITNEQLKLGAVNAVELLQQKNAYVQALQSYLQAKYTAALYNKIYEFYMGIPVTF
ncbi:MAG: TolC family protein [Ferruginibacter sp.]